MRNNARSAGFEVWSGTFWDTIPEDIKHLGLAVSGGGDSMAMLELARRGRVNRNTRISAVTVNHGLRAEADGEIALVESYCARHNIPSVVLDWDRPEPVGNLQDAARRARYALIADWGLSSGVDAIALGHTRDDQAETFLMRLGRAAGLDGLSEMDRDFHRHGTRWLRPVMSFGRQELRDYLKESGVDWADDASNEDKRFFRVRTRDAIGELTTIGIDPDDMAASARNLSKARIALDYYARCEIRRHSELRGGDVLLRSAIWDLPSEMRRRILVAALCWIGRSEYPPRASAIEDLESKLAGQERHTVNGCLVTPTESGLLIGRELNALRGEKSLPGSLWDGRWRVTGPARPGYIVAALGEGLSRVPGWRDTGLSRDTLMTSPAVWDGKELISAPLAGLSGAFALQSPTLEDFVAQFGAQ